MHAARRRWSNSGEIMFWLVCWKKYCCYCLRLRRPACADGLRLRHPAPAFFAISLNFLFTASRFFLRNPRQKFSKKLSDFGEFGFFEKFFRAIADYFAFRGGCFELINFFFIFFSQTWYKRWARAAQIRSFYRLLRCLTRVFPANC